MKRGQKQKRRVKKQNEPRNSLETKDITPSFLFFPKYDPSLSFLQIEKEPRLRPFNRGEKESAEGERAPFHFHSFPPSKRNTGVENEKFLCKKKQEKVRKDLLLSLFSPYALDFLRCIFFT